MRVQSTISTNPNPCVSAPIPFNTLKDKTFIDPENICEKHFQLHKQAVEKLFFF